MLIGLLSLVLILVVPPLTLLWLVVNLKKKSRAKGPRSWGFFHPFWYIFMNAATMGEEEKRCCGVWSKNWHKKRKTRSLFTVLSLTSNWFFKKWVYTCLDCSLGLASISTLKDSQLSTSREEDFSLRKVFWQWSFIYCFLWSMLQNVCWSINPISSMTPQVPQTL